jgi:hypothetical protein
MFRDGEVPNRKDALRIVERSGVKQKSSGSQSVVGALPGDGKRNRRGGRKPLGTLAKTAAASRKGGSEGFRKRTRKPLGSNECGAKRRYPPRRPKKTVEDERAARLRKFALQNCAVSVLRDCRKRDGKPMFRVCSCLRAVVPTEKTVGIQYIPKVGSSHYTHLLTCASVWVCPVCSSRIAEKRRDELARLIEKHIAAGGSCYMNTYTIAHHRYDDLRELLRKFLAARSDMKGSRLGRKLKTTFQLVGSVSVLEVTWSYENGWHPHVHEIIFCEGKEMDVDVYEKMARSAWEASAALHGLKMNKHGFKIDRTYGAVQDYILKFGCDPATERPWGVESEMARGHLKQGRTSEHYTPFALLAAIYDHDRDDLRPIFQEYAMCFKGRKQLNYSPGLKARYKEVEKDDDELLAEAEKEALTLVELDKESWRVVVGNDIRGELLEAARTGSAGVVVSFLAQYGIEAAPAPLAGYRVLTPDGVGVISLVMKCAILGRWRCSVMLECGGTGSWRAFDLDQVRIIAKEKQEQAA